MRELLYRISVGIKDFGERAGNSAPVRFGLWMRDKVMSVKNKTL
jgi:hypothetical protein